MQGSRLGLGLGLTIGLGLQLGLRNRVRLIRTRLLGQQERGMREAEVERAKTVARVRVLCLAWPYSMFGSVKRWNEWGCWKVSLSRSGSAWHRGELATRGDRSCHKIVERGDTKNMLAQLEHFKAGMRHPVCPTRPLYILAAPLDLGTNSRPTQGNPDRPICCCRGRGARSRGAGCGQPRLMVAQSASGGQGVSTQSKLAIESGPRPGSCTGRP